MPKTLNFFKMYSCVKVRDEMASAYQGGYERIFTGDDTFIYAYDPETTEQ